MAFKLTYGQLNNPSIINGLTALSGQKLPTKGAWNLSRMIKQVNKILADGREHYIELLKRYVELNEDGSIKPNMKPEVLNEDGSVKTKAHEIPGSYIVTDEEGLKKAVEEYMEIEVDIESYKIDLDDLAEITIEADLLGSLEPVIMNREEKLEAIQAENVISMNQPQ